MTPDNEAHKKILIERYLAGEASENELLVFFGLVRSEELTELLEAYMDADIADIRQQMELKEKKPFRWRWLAAMILAFGSLGGGYLALREPGPSPAVAENKTFDKAPGKNQATLTLANGQQIVLTKHLNGQLAKQGNTMISATSGGTISYLSDAETGQQAKPVYNTMSTRNGEQSPYPLVLADGTKVWLNAASSITFPTSFPGASREVRVTGEAYFEVAHNASKPFRVTTDQQTVEVLGTHFNISSYSDEPETQTTLLEGSVRVLSGSRKAVIEPGQMSLVSRSSINGPISVKAANTDQVMAWRKGLFHFDNAGQESVVRSIARWYDVKVVFQQGQPVRKFSGKFYRDVNLSQILQILNSTGIKATLKPNGAGNSAELIIN